MSRAIQDSSLTRARQQAKRYHRWHFHVLLHYLTIIFLTKSLLELPLPVLQSIIDVTNPSSLSINHAYSTRSSAPIQIGLLRFRRHSHRCRSLVDMVRNHTPTSSQYVTGVRKANSGAPTGDLIACFQRNQILRAVSAASHFLLHAYIDARLWAVLSSRGQKGACWAQD
jgi:hypothetical protein